MTALGWEEAHVLEEGEKCQGCRSIGERDKNDTAQVREVGRESDNVGL